MSINKDEAIKELRSRLIDALDATPRGVADADILDTIKEALILAGFPETINTPIEEHERILQDVNAYRKAWVAALRAMAPFFEIARDMMKAQNLQANTDMEHMTIYSDWLICIWEVFTGKEFLPDYYVGKPGRCHEEFADSLPLYLTQAMNYRSRTQEGEL